VPATDNKIALSASQHVWVEVKSVASGQSLFTGYLEMGERRDFQDAQGLRVRAGNGGSLTVDYLGKSEAFGLPARLPSVSSRVLPCLLLAAIQLLQQPQAILQPSPL
jgi:hypothetical protein